MRSLTALLSSLLLALAFFAGPTLAADLTIATVDFNKALNEIEDGKSAQERLDTMYQGKKAEIEQLEANLQALSEEYQAKQAVLSDTARQDYENRLMQQNANYQ